MRYLFDTTAWVWFFRKPTDEVSSRRQETIRQLILKEDIAICGIVLAEFVPGASLPEEERYLSLIARYPYLEIDRELCVRAGRLSRELKTKGVATQLSDCIVAAAAVEYDCTLVTSDRDFTRFPDLKLLPLE